MTRSALVFAFVALTSSAQHFPPLDQDNPPKSRILRYDTSFCMTARKSIPLKSSMPLFPFNFAPPGATGIVLIDGKTIKTLKDERHVEVYAEVPAGDHRFILRLDKPATNTKTSSHDDFKYCQR